MTGQDAASLTEVIQAPFPMSDDLLTFSSQHHVDTACRCAILNSSTRSLVHRSIYALRARYSVCQLM